MLMRLIPVFIFALAASIFVMRTDAATPQLVTWALRNTVDTDGDGVADLVDNAPGTFNSSQIDTDADGIGDIIDPTPVNSNPALGDPGLGMLGPYTIPSGSNVALDYLMASQTPPGAWGHIDLDLGGNGIYDATFFGPLTASLNQIVISAGQFELPGLYSQTVPGSYAVYAKAFGPGMSSQFETITGVNVVPEPTSLLMLLGGSLSLLCYRRVRPPALFFDAF
jgi:hypothetical protein